MNQSKLGDSKIQFLDPEQPAHDWAMLSRITAWIAAPFVRRLQAYVRAQIELHELRHHG